MFRAEWLQTSSDTSGFDAVEGSQSAGGFSMVLDVEVRVTCPDDEEATEQAIEAVLRIDEIELALWLFDPRAKSELRFRRSFRPFRGPWPVQYLLTIFFAPTILFGKRDIQWIVRDQEIPRLRISPFVPPEFWVDIQFDSTKDRELVAERVERMWNPPSAAEQLPLHSLRFVANWWRLVSIPITLSTMLSMAMGGIFPWAPGIGFGSFTLYVISIMVVEAYSNRKAQAPKRHRGNESQDAPM